MQKIYSVVVRDPLYVDQKVSAASSDGELHRHLLGGGIRSEERDDSLLNVVFAPILGVLVFQHAHVASNQFFPSLFFGEGI